MCFHFLLCSSTVRGFRSSSVRLVALDMDGTLLDSSSRIRPSSVQVGRWQVQTSDTCKRSLKPGVFDSDFDARAP